MKRVFKFLSASLIFAVMVLNANLAISADYKVGFIYIGPPGDHGWNYQHDVGLSLIHI